MPARLPARLPASAMMIMEQVLSFLRAASHSERTVTRTARNELPQMKLQGWSRCLRSFRCLHWINMTFIILLKLLLVATVLPLPGLPGHLEAFRPAQPATEPATEPAP